MSKLVDYLKSNGIDTNVGKFNFDKQLGEGGNSYVYLFNKDKKQFVIKFLKLDVNGNKIERFKDEYFALAQLPSNKGIVEQYHLDKVKIEDKDYYIIISKYYEMNLDLFKKEVIDLLPNKEKPRARKLIFFQLLHALKYMHNNKIIHRDIKPENIFINYDKEDLNNLHLIIGDFGIAHFDEEIYSKESHTKSSERLGNREFSAPEQSIKGEKVSYYSDIFSLGQIMFWLKYNRTFKGIDEFSSEGILDSIIKICLKRDPKERFKDIESIENYINQYEKKEYCMENFLYEFDDIIRKNSPEIEKYDVIENKLDIYSLINDLNSINRNNFLWYMDFDEGDNQLSSIDKSPFTEEMYIIRSGELRTEISIRDIILFRDKNSPFDNLIIIRTNTSPFFTYYDKSNNKKERRINPNSEFDQASFIGDKCIDPSETKNGYYKDISGKSTYVRNINDFVELERRIKPYLYVIAPKGTALNDWSRDGKSKEFLSRIMSSENIDNDDDIKDFIKHIQQSSRNYKEYRLLNL